MLGALVLCLALAAGAAHAEVRALLIGVSDYPALAPELRLQGPRNDVRRMREVLMGRGVGAQRIRLLADGVAGAALPTRENVLQALDRLAAESRPGDTVVVHFAGHGSREPAPGGGLRPILLPLDVGAWNRSAGHVANAIAADELRARIDRIADRGAFVWGIFDACHSAALVRGAADGPLRWRSVRPAELGIPDAAIERAAGDAGVPGATPPERLQAPAGPSEPAVAPRRGGTAFFYATQADELTPELRLPAGAWLGRTQGLFTYVVSQAIERARGASYRRLGQFVLAEYGAFDQAAATPLFSGDGLDAAALGPQAPPAAQWPLLAGPAVDAGRLSGIVPGTVFALVPGALEPDARRRGHLRVVLADAARAELEPMAFDGLPAPRPPDLQPGRGQVLRLVWQPLDYGLRVAFDGRGCGADCPLRAAVQHLRTEGAAGVALQWVEPQAGADLLLRLDAGRVAFLPPLAQAGDARALGNAAGLALRRDDEPVREVELAERIGRALHGIARARNLLALAARSAAGPEPDGLAVRLRRRPADGVADEPVAAERVPLLRDGDRLSLELVNEGRVALDVTALYLDAAHGINALFPEVRGALNRIEPGVRHRIDGIRVFAPPSGLERLVVIVRPARRGAERADYSFLAQPSLARQRGEADEDFQAFADAAFAEWRARGAPAPAAPTGAVALRVFTLNVRR